MSDIYDYGFNEETGGFAYYDIPTNRSQFKFYTQNVIAPEERSYFYNLAARKDATKPLGSDSYVYNIYEQLFKPYDEEIDYELGEVSRKYSFLPSYLAEPDFDPNTGNAPLQWIKDKAPELGIQLEAADSNRPTFESQVAKVIMDGWTKDVGGRPITTQIKTAADLNDFIDWYYTSSGRAANIDDKTKTDRKAYALNLLQAKREAENDWFEVSRAFRQDRDAVFDKRGLPSRDLRYDPRTVKGYSEWEKTKAAEFRKSMGRDPSEQELNQLRRMVADEYHKKGYSPYYDTILRRRAGS